MIIIVRSARVESLDTIVAVENGRDVDIYETALLASSRKSTELIEYISQPRGKKLISGKLTCSSPVKSSYCRGIIVDVE